MGGIQSHLPTRMWTASREDSELLAMRIRNYWFSKGYAVKTEVYGLSELGESYPSGAHIYSVRSNMLNGYPNPDPEAPIAATARFVPTQRVVPHHQMVRA
jgi:hypothetical protein